MTSQNLLLFSFCKTSKNKFRFSVVFFGKLFKSRSLKLNISRTAWRILTILVSFLQDFERPFRWDQLILALQFSFKANCQKQPFNWSCLYSAQKISTNATWVMFTHKFKKLLISRYYSFNSSWTDGCSENQHILLIDTGFAMTGFKQNIWEVTTFECVRSEIHKMLVRWQLIRFQELLMRYNNYSSCTECNSILQADTRKKTSFE